MIIIRSISVLVTCLVSLSSCTLYYDDDAVLGGSLFEESLIAYYPFNGSLLDNTGNGHDGIGTNTVFTTDRFGQANSACLFNGSSSYVDIPAASGFNLSGLSFTISMWVYQTNSGNDRLLGISGGGGAYVDVYLDGGTSPTLIIDDGFSTTLIGSSISTGIWYHIVLVLDGQTMIMYRNGSVDVSLVNGNSFVTYTGLQNAVFGNSLTYNKSFDGALDDLAIFNRALNSDEVNQLYNSLN